MLSAANKRMLIILSTSDGDQYRLDIDAGVHRFSFNVIPNGSTAVTNLAYVATS